MEVHICIPDQFSLKGDTYKDGSDQVVKGRAAVSQAGAAGWKNYALYANKRRLSALMQIGVGIVLGIAFLIVNLLTGNWWMACLAVFTITGIMLTALGCGAKAIMQWEFGVAESIATVVLLGCRHIYNPFPPMTHLCNPSSFPILGAVHTPP